VETDEWGFCRTNEFHPVQTSRAGVFAAGSFAGPADISATVSQAQSAALEAASLLWDRRKPLAEPPEPRAPEEPQSAIFVAGAGAAELGESLAARIKPDHLEIMNSECAPAIAGAVAAKLRELADVDRVVIAGPISWSWQALFMQELGALGLAGNKVEFVDTRTTGTALASRMAEAAFARLKYAAGTGTEAVQVTPAALVLGGGVSALTAARALAALGFQVHLLNNRDAFGGQAKNVHTTEHGQNVDQYVSELAADVEKSDNICIYLNSTLNNTAGSAGRFVSVIETPDGPKEIAHGAVVVATGADEYDFAGDGYSEGVITQGAFEKELLEGDKDFSTVVMIQCVGTLNEARPYCSRTCCAKAVKNALAAKESNPDAEVFILCREVITYGLHELAYKEARDKGVIFLRYEEERPPSVTRKDGKFGVRVRDPLLEEEVELAADKVVVSTGTVCTDGAPVAKALGIELDEFGFFKEANPKFRPVETDRAGIFICGLAQGPQSMDEAITQAEAAAGRAAAILARKSLVSSTLTSEVANRWCVGCELCVTVCPVHARVIDTSTKKAKVYSELCIACGACATVCPSSAAKSTVASDRQILSTIEILTSD
jgi:heterodisulfide reductase subunit A